MDHPSPLGHPAVCQLTTVEAPTTCKSAQDKALPRSKTWLWRYPGIPVPSPTVPAFDWLDDMNTAEAKMFLQLDLNFHARGWGYKGWAEEKSLCMYWTSSYRISYLPRISNKGKWWLGNAAHMATQQINKKISWHIYILLHWMEVECTSTCSWLLSHYILMFPRRPRALSRKLACHSKCPSAIPSIGICRASVDNANSSGHLWTAAVCVKAGSPNCLWHASLEASERQNGRYDFARFLCLVAFFPQFHLVSAVLPLLFRTYFQHFSTIPPGK